MPNLSARYLSLHLDPSNYILSKSSEIIGQDLEASIDIET